MANNHLPNAASTSARIPGGRPRNDSTASRRGVVPSNDNDGLNPVRDFVIALGFLVLFAGCVLQVWPR